MSKIKLLDCTLRDGGYINNWNFTYEQIASTITNLTNAGIDYIEIGYLTSILTTVGGSQFQYVETASRSIPRDRKRSKYVIMADVGQFDADTLCRRDENTVDGIRIVFYKRQIEQVYSFCEKVCKQGYDLFLQPMVTIDYSPHEFAGLVKTFHDNFRLYSIAIVDSFGCMNTAELHAFVEQLENIIAEDVKIGFHGHDNMQLSQINAVSLFDYNNKREFVIDSSVSGIGRGAGNLPTELFANYINFEHHGNYDLNYILSVASDVTEPISRTTRWGYSPYFMLTALKRAHPNFAAYLLANHDVTVTDFKAFLSLIPDNMLTKCTRPYVEELYERFVCAIPQKT